MFEIQCFAVFVLKFTGILSLNLCFISEVQWEPRLTSNLASTPFPSINSEVAAMQSWVPGHVCTYPMSIFTLEGAHQIAKRTTTKNSMMVDVKEKDSNIKGKKLFSFFLNKGLAFSLFTQTHKSCK